MNVISRAWLKEAIHNFFNGLTHEVTEEDIQRYIEVAPSAFEGMTNGEVFQAIFPCDEVHINGFQDGCVHFSMKSNLDSMDCFSLDWWNAPYKAESE